MNRIANIDYGSNAETVWNNVKTELQIFNASRVLPRLFHIAAHVLAARSTYSEIMDSASRFLLVICI